MTGIDWKSPETSVIHQTSWRLSLPAPGTSCRPPKATPAATSVFWTAVAGGRTQVPPLSPANHRSLPTKTAHPVKRAPFRFSALLFIIPQKMIGIDWKSLKLVVVAAFGDRMAPALVGRVCQSGSDLRARRACQPAFAVDRDRPPRQTCFI